MKKNKFKLIIVIVIIIFIAIYYIVDKKDNKDNYNNYFYEEEKKTNNEKKENEKIIIHLMGEVFKDGIFELEKGSRISDAIEMSGGLTEKADLSNINLAYILEDGMKIIIPSKKNENYIEDENSEEFGVIFGNQESMVNINTANQNELEKLPGVGSAIACEIVEFRKKNGKFLSIEEIKKVNGIGENKYNSLKNRIYV